MQTGGRSRPWVKKKCQFFHARDRTNAKWTHLVLQASLQYFVTWHMQTIIPAFSQPLLLHIVSSMHLNCRDPKNCQTLWSQTWLSRGAILLGIGAGGGPEICCLAMSFLIRVPRIRHLGNWVRKRWRSEGVPAEMVFSMTVTSRVNCTKIALVYIKREQKATNALVIPGILINSSIVSSSAPKKSSLPQMRTSGSHSSLFLNDSLCRVFADVPTIFAMTRRLCTISSSGSSVAPDPWPVAGFADFFSNMNMAFHNGVALGRLFASSGSDGPAEMTFMRKSSSSAALRPVRRIRCSANVAMSVLACCCFDDCAVGETPTRILEIIWDTDDSKPVLRMYATRRGCSGSSITWSADAVRAVSRGVCANFQCLAMIWIVKSEGSYKTLCWPVRYRSQIYDRIKHYDMKVGSVIMSLRSSWPTTIRSIVCDSSGLKVFSGSFQIYGYHELQDINECNREIQTRSIISDQFFRRAAMTFLSVFEGGYWKLTAAQQRRYSGA